MNQEGKASGRAPPEGLLHDALHGGPLCWLCSQHALSHFLDFRQMLYGLQGTATLHHCNEHTLWAHVSQIALSQK